MPSLKIRRHSALAATAMATLALAMPATTGIAKSKKKPLTVQAISASDKEYGAKAHPELLAEYGGAMTGRQADYVESVGKTISVHSGMSNARDDFTVTLVNSSVNNAFAIPGGYVYVTRQLAALMNNEAELAGVLGHEVGHVAAQHAKKRQKAAQQNAILGAVLGVATGVALGDSTLGKLGQEIFSQAPQLLTLRYSRKQETQADNLGISYLQKAGYDPRAMSSVLQSLANQNALEARLRGTSSDIPEWASTHPNPASRVRASLARAGADASGETRRDTFLTGINGLLYGDDPKQGVVEGSTFTHPDLRFAFQVPAGFHMINGTRAVSIGGQSGKGEFTGAAYSGDLDVYVSAVYEGLSKGAGSSIAAGAIGKTTINGLPVAYATVRANGSSGPVDVTVYAYEFAKDRAFHFLTMTQAGNSAVFDPMFQSVRRISSSEAAAVKPRKLSVVTVRSGDTLQSLAARMAYADAPMDRFLVLNGLTASSTLSAGQKVKLVTY